MLNLLCTVLDLLHTAKLVPLLWTLFWTLSVYTMHANAVMFNHSDGNYECAFLIYPHLFSRHSPSPVLPLTALPVQDFFPSSEDTAFPSLVLLLQSMKSMMFSKEIKITHILGRRS